VYSMLNVLIALVLFAALMGVLAFFHTWLRLAPSSPEARRGALKHPNQSPDLGELIAPPGSAGEDGHTVTRARTAQPVRTRPCEALGTSAIGTTDAPHLTEALGETGLKAAPANPIADEIRHEEAVERVHADWNDLNTERDRDENRWQDDGGQGESVPTA
jgi:hypothetical protein